MGCNDLKNVYIKNFTQFFAEGGGVIKSPYFSQSKIVHIILGGGEWCRNQDNFIDFSTFLGHFEFGRHP